MFKILAVVVVLLLCSGVMNAEDKRNFVPLPDGVSQYGDTVYMSISIMDFDGLRDKFIGLQKFHWKKMIIDLCTGGGSVFDAMAMVSLMDEQKESGKIIEIRGRGIIASAGLIVLQGGTPGYRFLDSLAMVMFHEMTSYKLFTADTPTSSEENARILRKIQDQVISFIVSRSSISKTDLDAKIKNKEFWMDANEAIRYGFADKIWTPGK